MFAEIAIDEYQDKVIDGYVFEKDGKYFILDDKGQHEVNQESIGQFTGIKDTNEKVIYEEIDNAEYLQSQGVKEEAEQTSLFENASEDSKQDDSKKIAIYILYKEVIINEDYKG